MYVIQLGTEPHAAYEIFIYEDGGQGSVEARLRGSGMRSCTALCQVLRHVDTSRSIAHKIERDHTVQGRT